MAYYRDLREYIEALDRAGKLLRVEGEISRETEASPFFWLQFRGLPEEQWRAFLYEKIRDKKNMVYPRLMMGAYYPSREAAGIALKCKPEEIAEKWCQANNHPIPPVLVDKAPVQEVIIEGEDLKKTGLWRLPSPLENPGWSGDLRTTNQFVTRDPETGIQNAGTYSGHFSGTDSIRWGLSPYHHAHIHWDKSRALGKKLPVAIVVGALPSIVFAATAPAPYGVDEFTLAGALGGEPVKLVKCKTVDLAVPATAEIVIEGLASIEYMEPKVAFGDYPGYVYEVENAYGQVIDVTCITHRQDPIFTAQVVGYHLNDTSIQGGLAREAGLYKHLKYDCYIPGVLEVAMPPGGGESNMVVVRIKKTNPWQPWQVLNALMGYDPALGKVAIVVDEDINPRDPQAINWSLSFSMQPQRDIRIVNQRTPNLDPSGYPPGASREERKFPSPSGSSAVLIDATRKWPYMPVGMPRKEFMEKALKMWEEAKLPRLNLKNPWYGYDLGRWTERDETNAQLALRGEHFKVADECRKNRKKL